MAFSLLLLPGHNFQFVGAGSKEWISVGLALLSDVMCFLSCITTRMMSYGTSPHVSLACGVREHPRATVGEGNSFILIADRKQESSYGACERADIVNTLNSRGRIIEFTYDVSDRAVVHNE
jgi:hypothetical protein